VQWYTAIEVLHADHKDSCTREEIAPENKMTSHFSSSSHTYNLNTAPRWYSMHIHIQLCYLKRGNINVLLTDSLLQTPPWRNDIYLIKKTAYILTKLSWQLNSMKLYLLATVTDGLMVSEQFFQEPPLFLWFLKGWFTYHSTAWCRC
jgi:hypothetical protein